MKFDCQNILQWTEAQLKYTYDVSLKDASAEELHDALGKSVMMAISDSWSHAKKCRMHERKAFYISAEYLIGRLECPSVRECGLGCLFTIGGQGWSRKCKGTDLNE